MDAVRESLYLDEWTERIAGAFVGIAASVYVDSGPMGPSFSSFNDAFAYLEGFRVPTGFEVSYETTENATEESYVLRVWHPGGWLHQSEDTAFVARSAFTTTPGETSTPTREKPETTVDTATAEAVSEVRSRIGSTSLGPDDDPTDEQLRAEGILLDGQEWSIEYNPADPTLYILRVWNVAGYLYDSKENAAFYDSYPKHDYRPETNFDASRF